MKVEKNEILKKLAARGLQNQLDQTQEECAELITAISKFRRKNGDPVSKHHVIEEIADVMIMLMQLDILFGHDNIKKEINEKLARSHERLQNGTI